MKILVIEDEQELSKSICQYLANEQFSTETAYDFNTAFEKFLYTIMLVLFLILHCQTATACIFKRIKSRR